MYQVHWCSIIARVLLFCLCLFCLEEGKLTSVPASKTQWLYPLKICSSVISVEVAGELTFFLPPQDTGLGLAVFCLDLLHGASRNSRTENMENLGEGFHGPGLEVKHLISAIFHWLELSHVVTPDYKEAGTSILVVCPGGSGDGF